LVGGGGAVAVVGAVLIGVGYAKYNDALSQCPLKTQPDGSQKHDCGGNSAAASEGPLGQTLSGAGWGVFGVGLAAAAGGLVWQLAFNKPGPASAPAKVGAAPRPRGLWISPATGPGKGGVTVGGSF
jgi:hypothetical protein